MKKLISLALMLTIIQSYALGIEYDDLNTVKEPAYRVGTTNDIENKIDIDTKIQKETVKVIGQDKIENLTYADLSIKRISSEISQSLEIDYKDMLGDLSILWQGAATQSDTIKYALYKLANPDKDKPDNNAIKKVLTNIASMSTLLGATTGNPLLACASLIGGNTLGIMSQDTKALNYKYTKVGDADMIILVRKVDELQQKVVDCYFDYMTTREILNMTEKMAKRRNENYEKAQNTTREVILITDAYYRESMDLLAKARGNYTDARSRLEQLVGTDVLKQFENNIKSRK